MTRAEHLQWCKNRAMEYVNAGDAQQGLTSIMSDLRKHPETESHAGIQLGMIMLMGNQLNNITDAEEFINGFN